MPETIRTPSPIDLTPYRVNIGDTVEFVQKINEMQSAMESWTEQDWDNFVEDLGAVASDLIQARDETVDAKNQVLPARDEVMPARDEVVLAHSQVMPARDEVVLAQSQVLPARDDVLAAEQRVINIIDGLEAGTDLRRAVEAASGGRQTVRWTDGGQPCIFNVIPAFNCEDIAPGGELGFGLHPAFIKNGVPVSHILIGAFQAALVDGELVSQPSQAPAVSRNYDQFTALATATGDGFGLMSNWDWAAVALWSMANGFEPRGNTNFGRHHASRWETGTRVSGALPGEQVGDGRIFSGSGPSHWRHDDTPTGISDLVGNVWEWCSGLLLRDGVFVLAPDGGTWAEADYVDTGVSAPAEGVWASRDFDFTFGAPAQITPPGPLLPIYYSAVKAANGDLVCVGEGSLFSRSTDHGRTWSAASAIHGGNTTYLSMCVAADGSLVCVGGSGACSRSTDNGQTWDFIGFIPGWSGGARGVCLAADGSLVCVGNNSQFSRSTDNGQTWSAAAVIGVPFIIESVCLAADGSLVCVGHNGQFSRSTDNGQTWAAPANAFGANSMFVVTRAANNNLVAMGSIGRFYISADNGQTWGSVSQVPGSSGNVINLVLMPDGSLVCVGESGRYSRSIDNGQTWSSFAFVPGWGSGSLFALVNAADGSIVTLGSAAQYSRNVTIPLRRAVVIPATSALAPTGYFWRNLSGERVPIRGGSWTTAGNGGLGALTLNVGRSYVYSTVGCRLRFRDQ